jgi:hypothetical protein
MDSSGSGQGQVAGYFEQVKDVEFLDSLSNYRLLKMSLLRTGVLIINNVV